MTPFGFHSASATWQRLIITVLGPELEPQVVPYLDNVVVGEFKRLGGKLCCELGKRQFCSPELKYLGDIVDRNGLHMDSNNCKSLGSDGTAGLYRF